ncbi:hypothetical protein ACLQ2R_37575 [Streptosporangium sp. DT93]|uniref:hypothetical protein n=1 Tax=Streptosporangium sp. DT93 TaxID=3393428 RepID=UPI003CF9EE77
MHNDPTDPTLSPATTAAIQFGIPKATRTGYAGDWERFARWCAEQDRTALPATLETVAEYTTHLTWGQGKKVATVDRALSSI